MMAEDSARPSERERTRTTRISSLRPPGAGALFVAQGSSELTPLETELLRQFMIVLQRLDNIERRIDALVGGRSERAS